MFIFFVLTICCALKQMNMYITNRCQIENSESHRCYVNILKIPPLFFISNRSSFSLNKFFETLTLSDPTSDLVRQYDFPVPLRCRKTFDTVFVAFVRPLSEPVRRFSSCSNGL